MITSRNRGFSHPSRILSALLVLTGLCAAPIAHAKPAPPAVPQIFYNAWVQQFDVNSGESQDSTAIALDHRGNAIVTGFAFEGDDATSYFYTAKYDALDGTLLWSSTYASVNGSAAANCVAIDSHDNIYVGGGALNNAEDEDFYLIKYSGTDGSTIWTQSYDGTAGGQDEIRKVIVDPNDNVVVTGISQGTSEGLDFETIKYDTNGVFQWSQRYDYDHQDDMPAGIACDGTGNIYVAGSATDANQNQVFVTLKYTAAGALAWTGTYQSPAATVNGGYTYGATAVVVDSASNAITTGHYTDVSNNDGFYTIKYDPAGDVLWGAVQTSGGIVSGNAGGARSVAVDGNNDVLVTGALNNGESDSIQVAKYSGSTGALDWSIMDSGTDGDTHSVQVASDGGGNAIIVGDATDPVNGSQDLYVAKYSQADGSLIWSSTFAGPYVNGDCAGTGVGIDSNGDISIAGIAWHDTSGIEGITGNNEIAALKYNRFLLETNDSLPANAGLAASPTVFAADPPALSDTNGFAALITINSGKAKPTAILTEDTGGGILLPAVQKGAAPGSGGTFNRFSDPVVASDGSYAFAATLSGVSKSRASGVWSNFNGTLQLALQQGTAVPGLPSANVSAVDSISLRDDQLLALLKVSGPASSSSVLLGIDSGLNGTVLVRSGQSITLGAAGTTVKTITALSPTLLSPGDGRWQGDANSVVKILAANGVTAICSVTPLGVLTPLLYTGEDASAVVAGASWKSFGLPGIDPSGSYYTTLGTLSNKGIALVSSSGGGAFAPYLQSGGSPADQSLAGLTFTGLTDPLINSSGDVATIVSLAGSGVGKSNKQALLYGNPASSLVNIARLGDPAADPDGNADTFNYASFISQVLGSGVEPAPVFVAKLGGAGVTAKNNMGLFAYGSGGYVRRLLRTGDSLGIRTVASFTILKAPSKSFAAARNFNATAQVALMVLFTDKTQALVELGIP